MTITPITLRPTTPSDIPYVLETESKPENNAFVEMWTEAQHLEATRDLDTKHLIAQKSDHPVGYVILQNINSENRSVMLRRIVISEKGQGYGKITCQKILQLCFGELNAHRVWLNCQENNEVGIIMYEHVGFVREGTTRDTSLHDGQFYSMHLYGMLETEFN